MSTHMRPMSERRQAWRDAVAQSPCGYDWLRAELRDLDRRRDASLALRLRTHTARRRIMRQAAECIRASRILMDAGLPDGIVRDLDGPRGIRTVLSAAKTPWARLHAENAWFLSSAAHSAHDDVQEAIIAGTSVQLAALAEQAGELSDGRRWLR